MLLEDALLYRLDWDSLERLESNDINSIEDEILLKEKKIQEL